MRCTTRQAYIGAQTPRGRTLWLCQLCAGEALEAIMAHLDGLSTHEAAEALVGVHSGVLLHTTLEAAGLHEADRLEPMGGLRG